MQKAIDLPRIFEISLATNDDSEDTLPWSPQIGTINVHEQGTASGNDSEITLPWIPKVKTIETIPRVESHKFNSLDERSQNESGSEEVPTVRLPLKKAYMAMKGALKATRKNKRKRKIKHKPKWHVNPKSGDKEWTPLKAKNPSTKILLIKNRAQSSSTELSKDEEIQPENLPKIWKQNNFSWFPSTGQGQEQTQTPQRKQETVEDKQIQKLLLTDKKSQLRLLHFYKSNWERGRKNLKEQKERTSELSSVEKSAGDEENRPQYISVISHHDTELE